MSTIALGNNEQISTGISEVIVKSTGLGFKSTNEFGRVIRFKNMTAVDAYFSKRPHLKMKIEW